MATDSPGFWADPKNLLSLLAVLISIISVVWTLASQTEQNRRWDSLNLSRVELTDAGFIIWKQLSRQEALSTNWGYKPTLFSVVQNRVYTGQYQLPYELILVDSNNKKIADSNGFFTLPEAEQELTRLGLKLSDHVRISKHYQIQFNFKNTGSTIANGTTARIVAEVPDSKDSLEVFKPQG